MKRFVLVLLAIVLSVSFFGCQDTNEGSSGLKISVCRTYKSFEELLQGVTDVVKAKCIDMVQTSEDTVYWFQVEERFIGEDAGEVIEVRTVNNDSSYISPDLFLKNQSRSNGEETTSSESESVDPLVYVFPITYNLGESYYLLLDRCIWVYTESEYYIEEGANLCIPASDIKKSTMLGTTLTDHSYIKELTTEQDLRDYIITYLRENPNPNRELYSGAKYIHSYDMETVIAQSNIVLRIKVTELDAQTHIGDNYLCQVVSTLKGDIEEDITINIKFNKGAVSVGKEYVVALVEMSPGLHDPRLFYYSAPDSVYSTWKQNKIEKIIEEGT